MHTLIAFSQDRRGHGGRSNAGVVCRLEELEAEPASQNRALLVEWFPAPNGPLYGAVNGLSQDRNLPKSADLGDLPFPSAEVVPARKIECHHVALFRASHLRDIEVGENLTIDRFPSRNHA